jgi:hypothetical protein
MTISFNSRYQFLRLSNSFAHPRYGHSIRTHQYIDSMTAATLPKAIFTTTAGICIVSLALVFAIRPDTDTKGK